MSVPYYLEFKEGLVPLGPDTYFVPHAVSDEMGGVRLTTKVWVGDRYFYTSKSLKEIGDAIEQARKLERGHVSGVRGEDRDDLSSSDGSVQRELPEDEGR